MPKEIIVGCCPTGLDSFVREWYNDYNKNNWSDSFPKINVYHADWTKYNKAAGPIRNKLMLEAGKPDLVIAFPGGNGTINMIKQAKEAGIRIEVVG